MRIWRISDYADLSGRGGVLAEGRWHERGTPVVYCADHPATAMLERLVHIDPEEAPDRYTLLAIDAETSDTPVRIHADDLPGSWRDDPSVTRAIGTQFLTAARHLLLFVPSALVPHAWNVLLSPVHEDAANCRIAETFDHLFDPRLIS
jgi:RES domain-containing protein